MKKMVPACTRELTEMLGKRETFHLTRSVGLTSQRCATCITVSPPSDVVSAGSGLPTSELAMRAAAIPDERCIEFHSKKWVHVVNVVQVMKPWSQPVASQRSW